MDGLQYQWLLDPESVDMPAAFRDFLALLGEGPWPRAALLPAPGSAGADGGDDLHLDLGLRLESRDTSKVMLVGGVPVRNSLRTAPYSWSLPMSVRYVRMLMTSARVAPCAPSRASMVSKTPRDCSARVSPSAICPERYNIAPPPSSSTRATWEW